MSCIRSWCVVLLFAASGGCQAPGPRSARPDQAPVEAFPDFVESELDLGQLDWYARQPFSLQFVNPMDRPVTISAVSTSCGCMEIHESELVGRRLEPGEVATIEGLVVAGAASRGGTEEVSVLLSGGLVRTARIRFSLVAGYYLRPKDLDFGMVIFDPVTNAAQPTVSVRRTFFESRHRHVTGVDWDVPWVEAEYHAVPPARTEIRVRLRPEYLDARFNEGHVLIHTDDPARPVASVRVRAEALMRFAPVPRWVHLTPGQRQHIFVVDDAGQRIPVIGVELGRDDLHAQLSSDGGVDLAWQGHSQYKVRTRARLLLPGKRAAGLGVYLIPEPARTKGEEP